MNEKEQANYDGLPVTTQACDTLDGKLASGNMYK